MRHALVLPVGENPAPFRRERFIRRQFGEGRRVRLPPPDQVIDASDGELGMGPLRQTVFVARLDVAGLKHAMIPAAPAALLDPRRQILDPDTARQFPAGLARLRNLHDGPADGVHIAQANTVAAIDPAEESAMCCNSLRTNLGITKVASI